MALDPGAAVGLQSVLNVLSIVAVGKWALLKFDQHRDQYARDREADAKANAVAREDLRDEMHLIESKVMGRVEAEVEGLSQNVTSLDRNVDRVLDAVRGSEFNPGGLLGNERRATRRRHAILNNLSIVDAKLLILTEVVAALARAGNVMIARADLEALRTPIKWDLSDDDDHPAARKPL